MLEVIFKQTLEDSQRVFVCQWTLPESIQTSEKQSCLLALEVGRSFKINTCRDLLHGFEQATTGAPLGLFSYILNEAHYVNSFSTIQMGKLVCGVAAFHYWFLLKLHRFTMAF